MKYGELNLGQVETIVNYDQSVEEAVKAGKYDGSSNDITSGNFPSEEVGIKEVSIELVHFGRGMKPDEVLSELNKLSLRPATLKELLALGEKHTDLQKEEFRIVALGSVWQHPGIGRRFCATLDGRDSKIDGFGPQRFLYSLWIDVEWDDFCRFAAVRK